MIIKRNKKIDECEINETISHSPILDDMELKTYEEEAIFILNLLDKEGINIYDINNTPGMYLKKKKQNKISENLKLKFIESKQNINKETNINVSNNEPQKLNNLFQYFKNNKNE